MLLLLLSEGHSLLLQLLIRRRDVFRAKDLLPAKPAANDPDAGIDDDVEGSTCAK